MSEIEDQSPQPLEPVAVPGGDSLVPPAVASEPFGPPPPPSGPPAWAPAQWTPSAPPSTSPTLWHRVAAGVVLAAVVATAAGLGIGFTLARALDQRSAVAQNAAQSQGSQSSQSSQTQAPQAPIVPATPGSGSQTGGSVDTQAIADKVDSAVVDINTVIGSSQAAGTGMVISSSGEVLTNNHVVDGSTSIQATLAGSGQTYTAHVVGVDPSADIAVIQLEGASGLHAISFASSSTLTVGQSVVALGNALGNGGTPRATQGSITGLDQSITASEGGGKSEQLTGMVQSDATIWPGDSGGPLLNSSAQVVGMITAGEAQGFRSSSSNISYAIPSDAILTVVNEIRAGESNADIVYGQVGYIGVSARTLDPQLAAQLGLSITSGALVETVQPGSAAAAAGIDRLSVITKVGGTTVATIDDLGTAVRSHKPGEKVSVIWVNRSGTHTAEVTLGGVNG